MKLSGNRNQCRGCKRYFNSIGAFDKHRIGKHGIDRRCMTDQEMTGAGMKLRKDGFWIGESMKGYREHEDKAEDSND